MGLYKSGGGGALSETVLWTNATPTSNFTSSNVTLSQSIEDFKKIRLYWRLSTTNTKETFIEIDVDEFQSWENAASMTRGAIACTNSEPRTYIRGVYCASNTSVAITNAYRLDASTSGNNFAIPTKICGLK